MFASEMLRWGMGVGSWVEEAHEQDFDSGIDKVHVFKVMDDVYHDVVLHGDRRRCVSRRRYRNDSFKPISGQHIVKSSACIVIAVLGGLYASPSSKYTSHTNLDLI